MIGRCVVFSMEDVSEAENLPNLFDPDRIEDCIMKGLVQLVHWGGLAKNRCQEDQWLLVKCHGLASCLWCLCKMPPHAR